MADGTDTPSPISPGPISPRGRRTLRILAFFVVPGLFCLVLVIGLVRTDAPRAVQGSPAPTFTGLDVIGGGSLSSSDLQGSPVVINFWASWCEPCQQEAGTIEAAFKQYQAQGVRVIGVDYEDTDNDARSFMSQYGVTYPSLRDPTGSLATQFGVRGVPETYFIDPRYRFFSIGQGAQIDTRGQTRVLGPISQQVLQSQIKGLLRAQAQATPSPAAPATSSAGAAG